MNISKIDKKENTLEISLAGILKIGKKLDENYILKIINLIDDNKIEKIVLRGNDPFNSNNLPGVNFLLETLEIFQQKHLHTTIYTNYTLENLLKRNDNYLLEILTMTDILYEGSGKNQRIIDLNETIKKLDKEKDINLKNGRLSIVKFRGD